MSRIRPALNMDSVPRLGQTLDPLDAGAGLGQGARIAVVPVWGNIIGKPAQHIVGND
jgi:hypothetical protein